MCTIQTYFVHTFCKCTYSEMFLVASLKHSNSIGYGSVEASRDKELLKGWKRKKIRLCVNRLTNGNAGEMEGKYWG